MRRLWTLGFLVLASTVSAALPDALSELLGDLGGRCESYVAGRVSHDDQLAARLDALKGELDGIVRALPDGDRRKTRVAELSTETIRLKERVQRPGMRYGQIGRELGAHIAAVRALDGPATVAAAPARRGGAHRSVLSEARGLDVLALAKAVAGDEVFVLRDAVAAPRFPGVSAPVRVLPPFVKTALTPLVMRSRGGRVTRLQEELNLVRRALGLSVIVEDGDFGGQTRDAVAVFQGSVGLPSTGVVDEETDLALFRWATSVRVNSFVQSGDNGEGVERVQDMLNRVAGYRLLSEDGDFRGRTRRAVRAFQHANGLVAHGRVDERTLQALEAAAQGKPAVGYISGLISPGPAPETWSSPRLPAVVGALAEAAAERHHLDRYVFRSLVWAEGGALGGASDAAAQGPAQITRSAAIQDCSDLGWVRVRDEAAANLECGARILSRRGRRYLGETHNPLIAASLYNTKAKHWERIARDNKVPPFRETTAYVTRISRMYCQITGVRLLEPNRDLYPHMLDQAKDVDRDMDVELALEGRAPRPNCSPF